LKQEREKMNGARMKTKKGCGHVHLHVHNDNHHDKIDCWLMRIGERYIAYNGDIYFFPNTRLREHFFNELVKINNNTSLYAEMDLKARLYKYARGRVEEILSS
jgi:hypothetical protein